MNPRTNLPCVATIAGTDPSGGAGIQADIKTISATGGYAASIIAVLVSQNTQGVQSIYPVSAQFIKEQVNSVFSDLLIKSVKLGMLYNQENIEIIVHAIQQLKPQHIVLDPVLVAKDGSLLLNLTALAALKEKLCPLATLITPNIMEAETLLGKKIQSIHDMELAAYDLSHQFKTNVLLKGGHLVGDTSSDIVFLYSEDMFHWFHATRIQTNHTHGTGCTLSAAIASYLAQDFSLLDAIKAAKHYLTHAIQAGQQLGIGQGCGPVDHFYALRNVPGAICF